MGQVKEVNSTPEMQTQFMRRSDMHKGSNSMRFTWPEEPDVTWHSCEDVVYILPNPVAVGGTRRNQAQVTFAVDMASLESMMQ